MDDALLSDLGKSLHTLRQDGPLLSDLLTPRQPSSGENAGKPASRPGSKPPLSVPIADIIRTTENTLGYWSGLLVAMHPKVQSAPPSRAISARAEWIHQHVLDLEQMPWAEVAASELIAIARTVADVVSPPESASDPDPVEFGTARVLESWSHHLGVPVSRSTIQAWSNTGVVPSQIRPDGAVLIRLADVLDEARKRRDQGHRDAGHQVS